MTHLGLVWFFNYLCMVSTALYRTAAVPYIQTFFIGSWIQQHEAISLPSLSILHMYRIPCFHHYTCSFNRKQLPWQHERRADLNFCAGIAEWVTTGQLDQTRLSYDIGENRPSVQVNNEPSHQWKHEYIYKMATTFPSASVRLQKIGSKHR